MILSQEQTKLRVATLLALNEGIEAAAKELLSQPNLFEILGTPYPITGHGIGRRFIRVAKYSQPSGPEFRVELAKGNLNREWSLLMNVVIAVDAHVRAAILAAIVELIRSLTLEAEERS